MSNTKLLEPVNMNEIEIVDIAERQHESPATSDSPPSKSNNQVDDVIVDIKKLLESEEPVSSNETCCIYKVPHDIRQLNEDAYTPKVVSIGPLHYGNPRLQNMQIYKRKFFKRFIKNAHTSLDNLVSYVKTVEPTVRACYSEKIKLGEEELVNLILLDTSFIIVLFKGWVEKDSLLAIPLLITRIVQDMLLLENQLPFFILEQLFIQAFPPYVANYSFLQLTFKNFRHYNSRNVDPRPIKHFTDLHRYFHLNPHVVPSFGSPENSELLYSASELDEAGVKFKTSTSKCLLNLNFSGHVLEIPEITVDDTTEVFLRNIIAFEQFQYPDKPYIASYINVLDYLINTSKDVDILIHHRVIRNHLADSNDVAKLYNGLGKNIGFGNFNSNYVDIIKRLNAFYESPWNNMKATLRHDYCRTPGQTVASIAGIVIIILTVVQTAFSFIK